MREVENTAQRSGKRKRRRTKRRLSKLAYGLILLLVALCAAAICSAVFLNAQTITVSGKSPYSSAQVIQASGIETGQNLLRLDKAAAANHICKKLPFVARAVVKIQLPTTIHIEITENKPQYFVSYTKQFALLDENLKALELKPDTKKYPGIIRIEGVEITKFEAGNGITFKNQTQAASIKSLTAAVRGAGIGNITSMNVADSYQLSVVYENRVKILLGSTVDAEKKLRDAAVILKTKIQKSDKGSLDVSTQNKRYTFSPS